MDSNINAQKNELDPSQIDVLSDQLANNPYNLMTMKDIGGRGNQRAQILAEAATKAKAQGKPFDIGLVNQRVKFLGEYENPTGRSAINRSALNNLLQHAAVEPLLNYLTEGSAVDSGISGNELIELRQNINKSMKAADPSVKQVLGHLLEGVDQTIDNLEGGTSETYRDSRTSYRDTLNDLKNPFVKAIRTNNVTDLVDGLTKGGNVVAKVNSLRTLIGDTAMQELGLHRFAQSISNALDKTTGSLNLNKFIKDWENIPDEVKKGVFANNPEDITMLNGWIDRARRMSRTVSNVKWGARAAGVGLTALGATGLLGDRDPRAC